MDAVTLSTDVLTWAAEQNGESWESVVEVIATKEKDRARIRQGLLTVTQIEKLAKHTHVPFGFLFLDTPPVSNRPSIPDLRQMQDSEPLGNDFFDQLEIVLARQDWYRDYQRRQGEHPLSFVGKYAAAKTRSPITIAQSIRETLQLTTSDRKGKSVADYYQILVKRVEALGVLVMKSGVVGSNTRRSLSPTQFRGFALVDDLAPVIFINGNDQDVAAVFTLIHELAHIWLGISGVSDLALPANGTEKLCNAIAGEVLVPSEEFKADWREHQDLDELAKLYCVSRLTIARRALDLALITQSRYLEIAKQSKLARARSGGGNAYATIPVRASNRFTRSLLGSAMSQDTMLRDAAKLLGCKPDTVMKLGQKLDV